MNRPLKSLLLVAVSLSVITMPIVSLAARRSGSPGGSHSQRMRSAGSVQAFGAPQVSRFNSSSSIQLGSANVLGRVTQPGRLEGNAIQPLPQLVPNVRPNRVPDNRATLQINPDVIRRIQPPVLSPRPAEIKPNRLGPDSLPLAGATLEAGVQSLVNNLAGKDKILKLKKDFLPSQASLVLGKVPELQKAQQYATKSLLLGPKCAWWVPWYYHCYWPTCGSWYWHHWHLHHFHVIPYHAGYSYYFGADLFAIPGIGLGVASVNPGSPADRAGLVVGDMIISANGQPLQTLDSNGVMRQVIRTSGGVLNMEVLKETGDQPIGMTAFLQRVYRYSY